MTTSAATTILDKDMQDSASKVLGTRILDLSRLPPLQILPMKMGMEELHDLEDKLIEAGAPRTYDSKEAELFIGNIGQKRRAVLELRNRGVVTEEITDASEVRDLVKAIVDRAIRSEMTKRRRLLSGSSATADREEDEAGDSTDSGLDDVQLGKRKRHDPTPVHLRSSSPASEKSAQDDPADSGIVHVIRLAWFENSLAAGRLQSMQDYVVYTGRRVSTFATPSVPVSVSQSHSTGVSSSAAQAILERAQADAPGTQLASRSFLSTSQLSKRSHTRPAHLIHQTTSEHDLGHSGDLPDPPDWVKRHSTYSCERATPLHGPNEAFVEELKKIRLARELTADEIGVRAYSTSIASLQAYPYTITDQREILALPGCDHKIASLWVEWKNRSGSIQAVLDIEADEHLKILRLFWNIWGVGAQTAREFYNRGWRDLDDIVEFGWHELSRVQQIGVKYYDEFLEKIPRSEVEAIGAKVHEHAQRVREPSGVRTCIVGGYRRGKTESGDVDVIVSHLDEDATLDIVTDVVKSLFDEGWITHELTTTLSNTRRAQSTLPWRPDGSGGGRSFDTLDKSLVVWQDPRWPGKGTAGAKNPNIHRRVDIIIAPWSKVGCGVLGWTAATTFERDLRRYAKRFKGWKFDSSGIRDRKTGEEVDLEGVGGRCTTIEEAERKVLTGLGLPWREPWEMCAG